MENQIVALKTPIATNIYSQNSYVVYDIPKIESVVYKRETSLEIVGNITFGIGYILLRLLLIIIISICYAIPIGLLIANLNR